MGEHGRVDHLVALLGFLRLFMQFFQWRSLQFRLLQLLLFAQRAGDALDAVLIGQARHTVSAVRQVLACQVQLQFAVHRAHGDTADAVVFVDVVASPGPVDGDVAAQRAAVHDPHGEIAACAAVAVAVQNPLSRVPYRPRDDGFVVVRLEVLVFLVDVPFGLVVVEVGRPRLACQNVAAVALVAEHGNHPSRRPVPGHFLVLLEMARRPLQVDERLRDLRGAAAVEQHVVHEPHRIRFRLVDDQFADPVPVRPVLDDLVIAQQGGGEKAAPAEAPLQRQQHCLALHVALFLGHHRQHEQDDVAGGLQCVNVLLLEKHLDGRVHVLQLAHPLDAVHKVPGETGDRLRDNHVEAARQRVLHHQAEGGSVLRIGSGEPVVRIGAAVDPLGIGLDLPLVLVLLQLNGNRLVQVVR